MRAGLVARVRYGGRLAWIALSVTQARLGGSRGLGQRQARAWNTLFRRSELDLLKPAGRMLEGFNASLQAVLSDPRVEGQLLFEYGTLVDWVTSWPGLRVLDVGTGRSTFPQWMASRGATVVRLDHPAPIEVPPAGWLERLDRWFEPATSRPPMVGADMTILPFGNAVFDLVTCLSVLEHLDTELPARRYVPPEEQARRLRVTLAECVRVLRPGGHLYLTTECCDFDRATTDKWRPAYYFNGPGPDLSGAWPAQQVRALFVDALDALGCELVGADRLRADDISDSDTWTWRGPYFSAVAILARKRPS